jgi:hypothetical protein
MGAGSPDHATKPFPKMGSGNGKLESPEYSNRSLRGLTQRLIGLNDYAVFDEGNSVGWIRNAAERANDVWLWNVTIPEPWWFCCSNASRWQFAIRPVLSVDVSCRRYPSGKGPSGSVRRF